MVRSPLSILDLVPLAPPGGAAAALRASTDLARLAESRGFRRYWVGEHHGVPNVGAAAPAVLIAHLAAATTSIRLGSGGVMLANHAPMVVAEQFATLEGLHPGRIDLGVGSAAGATAEIARVLRQGAPAGFAGKLADLAAFLDGRHHSGIRVSPAAVPGPPLWLLGASESSARLAGELGLPYAFAHHLNAAGAEGALGTYRGSFRASARLGEPYCLVSVAAIAADTEEAAFRLWRAAGGPDGVAVGDGPTVRGALAVLSGKLAADELMIVTNVFDAAARRHSYTLLAPLS
ncbi:luciferase family oxidoreductase, group 1 [Nonomuraea solani]|uniref:Luciferase family oxidoreductase, group 1 n=1 Tax=Nonomuraea solani TaxID=1144553 RepID=A0A1H6CSC5_9ACTN|nr:MsnO8 family LLM class oxidoreductase [Nonomuraea solani]SEG75553.1 luciferase family oxidoreductase, group 1 [Nonomuraea solani]